MSLFVNQLKITFRNLWKKPFFWSVNILGLSLAVSFVFLSFSLVNSELGYDDFHENKENLFRIYSETTDTLKNSVVNLGAITSIPLIQDLSDEVPGIIDYTRIGSSSITLESENQFFQETIHFIDAGFFRIFDFPIVSGSIVNFENQTSVVISKEYSKKLFGDSSPIGKTLSFKLGSSSIILEVIAIIDPLNRKSSLAFEILLPIELYRKIVGDFAFTSYEIGIVENYVLTNRNSSKIELSKILTLATERKNSDKRFTQKFGLQPLKSIHTDKTIVGNAKTIGINKLYGISILALIVLVISIINFIMLSAGDAINKAKELGIRSTLGATTKELKFQMVCESLLISIISSLLGLLIAFFFLPYFSQLMESTVFFSFGVKEILFIGLMCLLIALTNSIVQSFLLLKNSVSEVIKQKQVLASSNNPFNKSLLVIQFSISVLFIAGALVIRQQMEFVSKKDLGFIQENLVEIVIPNTGSTVLTRQLVDRFETAAFKSPHILQISASMNNVDEPWTKLEFENINGGIEELFYNQVDPNYIQTMGIELILGENFRSDYSGLGSAIIVNEALVRSYGWENPLNEQLPLKNINSNSDGIIVNHQIIGVVKDFHFSSLHENIEPLILSLDFKPVETGVTGFNSYIWPTNLYRILVKISAENQPEAISFLQKTWRETAPEHPFLFNFVENTLDTKYAKENRWRKIISSASFFSIFIAWIGLLGLLRLTVQSKIKEIGIRKVLGASINQIIGLISRQFIQLILIGTLIAFPIAWFLLSNWLSTFSYKIDLNPYLFMAVGLFVVIFTFVSIYLQSRKIILMNPVDSLKTE